MRVKDGDKVWAFMQQSLRHTMIVMTREERVHTTRRALIIIYYADGPPPIFAETLRLIQKEAY